MAARAGSEGGTMQKLDFIFGLAIFILGIVVLVAFGRVLIALMLLLTGATGLSPVGASQ